MLIMLILYGEEHNLHAFVLTLHFIVCNIWCLLIILNNVCLNQKSDDETCKVNDASVQDINKMSITDDH